MAGILGMTYEDETKPSVLIAGEVHLMKKITLAEILGTVARGTVLGQITDTMKWAVWDADAVDGSQIPRAILADTVTVVGEAADVKANAYFAGMYRFDDIVWPNGISNADKAAAIQALAAQGVLISDEELLLDSGGKVIALGAQGAAGAQGAEGAQGPQGPQGPQGEPGA